MIHRTIGAYDATLHQCRHDDEEKHYSIHHTDNEIQSLKGMTIENIKWYQLITKLCLRYEDRNVVIKYLQNSSLMESNWNENKTVKASKVKVIYAYKYLVECTYLLKILNEHNIFSKSSVLRRVKILEALKLNYSI